MFSSLVITSNDKTLHAWVALLPLPLLSILGFFLPEDSDRNEPIAIDQPVHRGGPMQP